MEIARSAATIFKLSDNVEKKRLFLSFLFDRLELNEGRIGYKLRYPFNEFQNAAQVCEPAENKGFEAENDCILSGAKNGAIEPNNNNKNRGLQENASLCSGWLEIACNLRTSNLSNFVILAEKIHHFKSKLSNIGHDTPKVRSL
jgi:hypothetical protein